MWRYHFALMLLMFGVNGGECYQIPRVMIEPKSPLCIEQGNTIILTCTLDLNTSSLNATRSSKNVSLIWYHNGLQLTTMIHHTNNSIIFSFEAKSPGLFTCAARDTLSLQILANRSVSIDMRPNPVANLIATPKFISDEDTFRYVMVSWLRQGLGYVYNIFFQIDLLGCFSSPCVDDSIEPTCNGTICTALLDTEGHDLSDLAFFIETRQGACAARSRVWNYNLTLSSCGVLPPKTLFYVPYSPTKLAVETSYRSVTIRWKDNISWLPPAVSLTYTCSKTSLTTKLIQPDIRIIRLSDKDIRSYAPYDKCTFCLSIQEYYCGQFSEPLCKTTRLHEEPPRKAPTITCTNDTCPTSYDDQFRNLTVTWELPAKKYWGGVLREIKLRHFPTELNTTWQEIVLTNLSAKSVVVNRLNKTLHYSIYLQACNRQGCSGYSNQLQIYGIRARQIQSTKSNNSINLNIIWYFIIGAIGFILVMVACIFVCAKLFFKERKDLESLSETDIPHYTEADEKREYDELSRLDNEQCDQLYNEDDSRGDETRPVPSFV